MTNKEIRQFILEKAQRRMELLGIDGKPDIHTDLVKEGIFDSLAFVDLIAECEEKFAAEIDLEKYDTGTFTRINSLTEIIAESVKK